MTVSIEHIFSQKLWFIKQFEILSYSGSEYHYQIYVIFNYYIHVISCVLVEESDYGTPDYDPVGGASAPPLPAASRPSLEKTKTPVSVVFNRAG